MSSGLSNAAIESEKLSGDSYVNGVPQLEQKPRRTKLELSNRFGSTFVHLNLFGFTETKGAKKFP